MTEIIQHEREEGIDKTNGASPTPKRNTVLMAGLPLIWGDADSERQ